MPRSRDRLPDRVRAALEQVFGEPVDDVELVEHSWYAKLHRGARATTRRNRILLPGSVDEFLADPDLVLHEYYHVLRQWNRGRLSIPRYLGEWLRRGYLGGRDEREARRYARTRLDRYLRLARD